MATSIFDWHPMILRNKSKKKKKKKKKKKRKKEKKKEMKKWRNEVGTRDVKDIFRKEVMYLISGGIAVNSL